MLSFSGARRYATFREKKRNSWTNRVTELLNHFIEQGQGFSWKKVLRVRSQWFSPMGFSEEEEFHPKKFPSKEFSRRSSPKSFFQRVRHEGTMEGDLRRERD